MIEMNRKNLRFSSNSGRYSLIMSRSAASPNCYVQCCPPRYPNTIPDILFDLDTKILASELLRKDIYNRVGYIWTYSSIIESNAH